MDARVKTVRDILDSGDQYVVPFFQRHYFWTKVHWGRLHADIPGLIKKPEILKNSALALNRYFHDKDEWNETLITARGEVLFAHALDKWSYPAITIS